MTETLELTRDEAIVIVAWMVHYPDEAVRLDPDGELEAKLVAFIRRHRQEKHGG